MSDDYQRELAWTQRRRELDAENHDLRRRLRQLHAAALEVSAFIGQPKLWSMLHPSEQRKVHALADALVKDTAAEYRESMRRPGGDA